MQTGLELEGDTGADFHPCPIPLPQKYCPVPILEGWVPCRVFTGGIVIRQCNDFDLMLSQSFAFIYLDKSLSQLKSTLSVWVLVVGRQMIYDAAVKLRNTFKLKLHSMSVLTSRLILI